MVAGTMIVGIFDLTFNGTGYLCAFVSSLAQAGAMVWTKKSGREKGHGHEGKVHSHSNQVWATLYFNSMVSSVLMVFVIVLRKEWTALQQFPTDNALGVCPHPLAPRLAHVHGNKSTTHAHVVARAHPRRSLPCE